MGEGRDVTKKYCISKYQHMRQQSRDNDSSRCSMMALMGANGAAVPGPPKIHQKMASPTQEIALFLYISIRTSMACQKKKKFLKTKTASAL